MSIEMKIEGTENYQGRNYNNPITPKQIDLVNYINKWLGMNENPYLMSSAEAYKFIGKYKDRAKRNEIISQSNYN